MEDTLAFLQKKGIKDLSIQSAVILGSGMSVLERKIDIKSRISYNSLPDFPPTTVSGHRGELILGSLEDHDMIVFSGRFHIYEGYSHDQVVLPVRLANALNAQKLILTNSAGGINLSFQVGDLMIIEDTIRFGKGFTPGSSNSHPYRGSLTRMAKTAVQHTQSVDLPIRSGTYLFTSGPSYETSAEIEAFRRMGADAVGMSTVPEIDEAARLKLPVIGFSLISNLAADVHPGQLSHDKIQQTSTERETAIATLILQCSTV